MFSKSGLGSIYIAENIITKQIFSKKLPKEKSKNNQQENQVKLLVKKKKRKL